MRKRSIMVSSVPIMPVAWLPSATTTAPPLTLARSMMQAGLNLCDVRDGISQNQPSFGVGIDHFDRFPDMARRISPGFIAVPLGRFSEAGTSPMTRRG